MASLQHYQHLKGVERKMDEIGKGDIADVYAREAEHIRKELLAEINAALAPTGYTLEEIVKADLI